MHPSDAIAIRPHHRRARAAPAQQPAPERRSAIRAGFQPAGLLTFLALLLFPLFSRASDSTSVEAILFIGNDHTREEILLRELQLRPGDPFDAQIAELDRQRIENLRLFTRVELLVQSGASGVILVYLLSERWYIFPYPLLFIHDRDWGKLSYGAGLRQENFRGRNITLLGSFWLGYNPAFNFGYTNPWLDYRRRLSLSLQLNYSTVANLSQEQRDFDERHFRAGAALGKRFGYYARTSIAAAYREVHLPPELGLTAASDGVDRGVQLSAGYRYDNRDLALYATRGWFFDTGLTGNLLLEAPDYLLASFDLRRYQPLGAGISLASRARLDWSGGRLPLYDRLFIGFAERIRGHFNSEREGEGRLLGSVELRMPLLGLRFLNLQPEGGEYSGYLRDLPLAVYGALFVDGGMIAGRSWERAEQRRLGGFGLGLHFRLPYVELLRLERAWGFSGGGEYILDMKAWF